MWWTGIFSTKCPGSWLNTILTLFWLFCLNLKGASAGFGPTVKPSHGAIWPKPKFEKRFDFSFAVDPKDFQFQVVNHSCPILVKAIERYASIIKTSVKYGKLDGVDEKAKCFAEIDAVLLPTLRIDLKSPCEAEEYPSDLMDESYNISLTHTSSATMYKNSLAANSIWGILRGLESFSQILVPEKGGRMFIVNGVHIIDSPRFPYRGLLLDTSRHFFSVPEILRILDGMAYSKMNIFHWHIVDDQAFSFQSMIFPDLSEKGAYHPELAVYRPPDVLAIIEYARDRGIRVIPEFDTPGHTLSWGQSVDGLLAKCSSVDEYGPVDPSNEQNYVFLAKLFAEVASVFKDKYIHLGGDEVDIKCWSDNESIRSFMSAHGMGKNFSLLETYYFSHLFDITDKLNLKPIVWQEVLDYGVSLDNRTIVHAWRFDDTGSILPIVTKGYQAIYSSCWYLDDLKKNWKAYYQCDILDFKGSPQEKALVIGGEACMWGEMVDETNVSPRIWPRACAVAERLWTYGNNYAGYETNARMEEHSCRLKRRGIPTSPPNGPNYCPVLN